MKILKEEFEISDILKEFIKDHSDLINENKFDELYKLANTSHIRLSYPDIGELTRILLEINVNPLYYLSDIPDGCFFSLKEIKHFKIPSNMKYIGQYAFYHCSGITSLDLGAGVKTIEYGAFESCSGITELTIPSSVTSIGKYAFRGCSGLTSITIPSSVGSIGNNAFNGCSGLTSITIPEKVTSIEDWVFSGCSGLKGNLTIPEGVTSIGNGAFSGCEFTTIELPESLESIGKNALSCSNVIFNSSIPFEDVINSLCGYVKSITYPTSIDWYETYKNSSKRDFAKLEYVTIHAGSETYKYDDILKIIDSKKPTIPILYRVGDSITTLIAYNSAKTNPKVSFRANQGLKGTDCPVFFKSAEEAEDFINRYNKLGNKYNSVNKIDIHPARLSSKDINFSLIETECGECLIQSWKSKYIDPTYVKQKEYF